LEENLQLVYIDESGNTVIPGNSDEDFYVITAISIPASKIEAQRNDAKKIVNKHAGSGELKSKSIGNNFNRRRQILTDIKKGQFSHYSLVVDKQRIWKESGLQYRPVFYKYLHKIFYSRINRSLLNIEITTDNYGSTEFMESFIKYVNGKGSLFDSINFVPSPAEPLLQISDVIAGTIRRIYLGQDSQELFDLLDFPIAPIEEWPPADKKFYDFIEESPYKEFDSLIRKIALNSARKYIQENAGNTDKEIIQIVETIRFLLIKFHDDPHEYVFRDQIIRFLKTRDINISERLLSTKVLAKARDEGVLVTGTEKGVKIPFDSTDLFNWVSRVNSQVVPYLNRLKRARIDLLVASHSEYNIVEESNFPELFRYLHSRAKV
jgi:hypothetical protein